MEGLNEDLIRGEIRESIAVKRQLLSDPALVSLIGEVIADCVAALRRGNRIFLAGNGGSAADAQHLAAEFVSRFSFDRPGLPAQALTTDSSILTAVSNDYGYEQVFRRQLVANGRRGDVFIGLSTSGNSPNVIEALRAARANGIVTIGLTGQNGQRLRAHCDRCIEVPSRHTARIQESHIMIGHVICGRVEDAMFGGQGVRCQAQ